jgi:hypothetical protein
MAEALRLFFLAFYAIGVVVLVLRVLPLAFRSALVEQRAEGTNLYLPFVLLLLARLLLVRLLHGRGDAANLNGQQRLRNEPRCLAVLRQRALPPNRRYA